MNHFEFYTHENVKSYIEPAGVYFDIPKEPGLMGLKHPIADVVSRACVWTLKKFGVLKQYRRIEDTVERHTVHESDCNNLTDFVMQQLREVRRWPARTAQLYIGPDEFNELMHVQMKETFDFRISRPITNGRETMMFGLEVHVIPWMKGALVIPATENVINFDGYLDRRRAY